MKYNFIIVLTIMLCCSVLYAEQDPYNGNLPYIQITPNSYNNVYILDDYVITGYSGSEELGYLSTNATLGFFKSKNDKQIPFSSSTISNDFIKNIGANTPEKAFIAEPTISTLMSSYGYSSMNRIQIRGFNASDQNTLRNGMVDRSFTVQPMEDIAQINVLHGLSGFLYGFSAIGGVVDYETKAPRYTHVSDFSVNLTDTFNTNISFNTTAPIGDDTAFRLTGAFDYGEIYLDNSDVNRKYVSGEIVHDLTDTSFISFGFYYQNLKQDGIPSYFNIQNINYTVPSALDSTIQYGEDWTNNESEKFVLDLEYQNQITNNLKLRLAARYADMFREYSFIGNSFINENEYTKTYVDSSGNDETATAGYALIDYNFDVFDTFHTLTFGYTHSGFTFERGSNYIDTLDGVYNINNVTYNNKPIGEASGYDRKMKSMTHNIVLGDDITWGKFDFMLGVNFTMLDVEYYGVYASDPKKPSDISQDAFTPMFGVSYSILDTFSIYGSYMEGVEQGGTAPSSAVNAYDVLDPMISKQYEIGIKNTWFDTFNTTFSLFRIEKTNQYTDPIDNVYKQDGEQIHQGIEFLSAGKIDSFTIVGGLSFVDAEINNASNKSAEGHSPVNIPEMQAKIHIEYMFENIFNKTDLTLFGGVNYFDKRPVNIPNTSYIDSADIYHSGIRLRYNKNTTISLIATNLFDKKYWSYYRTRSDGMNGDDGLFLGSPRTFSLLFNYEF